MYLAMIHPSGAQPHLSVTNRYLDPKLQRTLASLLLPESAHKQFDELIRLEREALNARTTFFRNLREDFGKQYIDMTDEVAYQLIQDTYPELFV